MMKIGDAMTPAEPNYRDLTIHQIAYIISKDWTKVYFGAEPYLEAMHSLDSINDNYMLDSGKSVVLYFLSNANSWRGEVARNIKKELKRRVK